MNRNLDKSALRGEASYVWRDGQQRRMKMIVSAADESRIQGDILDNGCGVGLYVERFHSFGGQVYGLEYDFPRARLASSRSNKIISAAGEALPYPDNNFDLILSHEVIEHVLDDAAVKVVIYCNPLSGTFVATQ